MNLVVLVFHEIFVILVRIFISLLQNKLRN